LYRPTRETSLDGLKICDIVAFVKRLLVTCSEYECAIQRLPIGVLNIGCKKIRRARLSSGCGRCRQGLRTQLPAKLWWRSACGSKPLKPSRELNPTTAASTWKMHHTQDSMVASLSVQTHDETLLCVGVPSYPDDEPILSPARLG
jgi:hypothetical protein